VIFAGVLFCSSVPVSPANREKTTIPDSATFYIESIELVDSAGKIVADTHNTYMRVKEVYENGLKSASLYSEIIKHEQKKRIKLCLPRMEKAKELTYEFFMVRGDFCGAIQKFKLSPPLYNDTLRIKLKLMYVRAPGEKKFREHR